MTEINNAGLKCEGLANSILDRGFLDSKYTTRASEEEETPAVSTLANCLLKFFFTQTFLFYSIFWGEKNQFLGQNSFSVSEIIFALSDSSNWYEDLRCYFIFCYRFKMCIFLVWASIVILVLLRSRDVKSGLKNWLWFGHKRLLTDLAGLVDYFSFSDPTRSRERERLIVWPAVKFDSAFQSQ